MTRNRRCEACGCYTVHDRQYGLLERVVCNECSRRSDTDLSGTMDGVVSAKRDEVAEPFA